MNFYGIPLVVALPGVILLTAMVFALGIWLTRQPNRFRNDAENWARQRGCEIMERKDLGWHVRHPVEGWTLSFTRRNVSHYSSIAGHHTWSKALPVGPDDILLVYAAGRKSTEYLESICLESILSKLGLDENAFDDMKTRLSSLSTGDREFDKQWRIKEANSNLAVLVSPQMRSELNKHLNKVNRPIAFAIHESECKVFESGGLLKPHELNDLAELGRRLTEMLTPAT